MYVYIYINIYIYKIDNAITWNIRLFLKTPNFSILFILVVNMYFVFACDDNIENENCLDKY